MTDSDAEIGGVAVSRKSGISIFWIIPLVALAIGGWLSFKAYTDQGPLVTITFKKAEGVVAEKTKVRLRDVDVGMVESVDLSDDLQTVIVKARLKKDAEKHLFEGTRFWVETPRVSATEVKGLETLLSGVFIGIDPVKTGNETLEFTGLDNPPFIADKDGRFYQLYTLHRGSINPGSPVTYRGLDAGQVVSYKMDEAGEKIEIKIFVKAPFYQHIHTNTRFWESSGVHIKLSAEGFQVDTESMASVLIGGISFGRPEHLKKGEPVAQEHKFLLFADKDRAVEKVYDTRDMVMYFDGSVRGLEIGAPVEFRGMKIGEVTDIRLQFDAENFAPRIPVYIETYHGRFETIGKMDQAAQISEQGTGQANLQRLVDNGMRARLESGNLLTGARIISIDMYPDEPKVEVVMEGERIVIPTLPTSLDELTEGITTIINKISAMPLEQIGKDLQGTIKRARQLLESNEIEQAVVSLNSALKEAEAFANSMNTKVTPQLDATLRELKNASRSIKAMADYLERHPEALIKGKGK